MQTENAREVHAMDVIPEIVSGMSINISVPERYLQISYGNPNERVLA